MGKLRALLLTEGMHGMISQVEGMAKALNTEFSHKIVRLSFPWNLIPPKFTPVSDIILEDKDYLFSHHRSHGYYLAKNAPMKKLFAEIYGKETGANSGIAGSQDISFPKNNFYSGAILAGAVSIAAGAAVTLQMNKKNNQVVVAGFGEAATDEGVFWETINYAALKKLPIIFICENNNYSVFFIHL